jgi:hypothetical protein
MSALGTKRAGAQATDVRGWWKLTYQRSGGIRVLTLSGFYHPCFATRLGGVSGGKETQG